MFKKIIGFVLILIIFYFAIKALAFLPVLNGWILGPSTKSPFQVGTDYVSEVNEIYPYGNYNAKNTKPINSSVKYNSSTNTNIIGKITLEKMNGSLIMSIESASTNADLNIWLVNTPSITNETQYIDFGKLIKNNSILQYVVDMKGGDVSLEEYNTVFLLDTKSNYQTYAKIILK